MKKFFVLFIFVIANSFSQAQNLDKTITQISTINALLTGVYDGQVTLGELKKYGNFGIGTFNKLDGEMVISDGKCFQIKSDGTVNESPDTTKTPFSAVAFFYPGEKIKINKKVDFKTIENMIDSIIPTKNIFYGVRVKGKFNSLKARSVAAQNRPYKPLTEVVKNQSEFNFQNVEGELIGFRCPQFVNGVNVPGYHMHFIKGDKKAGGHVLNFEIENAELYIVDYSNFKMLLPNDKDFYNADLNKDRKEQLNKVEK